MTNKRVCVFCGAGNLTSEHVLPNWIAKMFTTKLKATTTIEKQGQLDKIYKKALLQHKAKVVCAKCNNGWMSQLEADIKPILSRMLFTLDRSTDLGAIEQNILAFWAQKTVMILSLSTETDYRVPSEFFTALFSQQKPIKELVVRLGWRIPKQGKYGPHLSHFTISNATGPEKPVMVAKFGEFELWKAIFTIGNVVFHISGSTPNINVEARNIDKRVMPQIFPYKKDITWPLEWPVDALTSVGFDEFSRL